MIKPVRLLLLITIALLPIANHAQEKSGEIATTGAWVRTNARDTSAGTKLEQGQAVFHNRCSGCHGEPGYVRPDGGSDMPGTSAINFKYKKALPGKLEDRDDLTPALVKYFVRNGSMFMPAFRKTYITDTELDALAAYLSKGKP